MNYKVVNKCYKAKKRGRTTLIVLLLFAVVITASVISFMRSMTPAIVTLAVADVKTKTLQWVNGAVFNAMGSQNGEELVSIERNADGDITSISSNTVLINTIARQTIADVHNSVTLLSHSGVDVPLGTATGLPLLTGKGPVVSVDVDPVGRAQCVFRSSFTSQGINQTLHRIYLDVEVTVDIVMAGHIESVVTKVPVIVSETVVVGKIPSVYLDGLTLGQVESGYKQLQEP